MVSNFDISIFAHLQADMPDLGDEMGQVLGCYFVVVLLDVYAQAGRFMFFLQNTGNLYAAYILYVYIYIVFQIIDVYIETPKQQSLCIQISFKLQSNSEFQGDDLVEDVEGEDVDTPALQDLFCFDAPQLTQGMTVTCAEWNSNNKECQLAGVLKSLQKHLETV